MTDQTPSTEHVRLLNVLTVALADAAQEDDNNFIPFTKRTHYANAIMAHLEEHRAARDREVAAKALYDARDDWRKGGWAGTPHHHDRGRDRIAAAQYAGNWLNDRADRIEAGTYLPPTH